MTKSSTIGAIPPRADGRAKVDGSARYVDDLRLPGMWHGATVRCPHARARIAAIDARAFAGEPDLAIVTAADIVGPNALHLIADDWPVLAESEARHAGEAVALVAAPTRERARAVAAAIAVSWEPLPAITNLAQAVAASRGEEDARPAELARCEVARGDVEAALAGAEIVVESEYATAAQEHLYIEPQGVIAVPHADGALEIHGSLQCPFYVHKALAPLFGLEPAKLRVRQTVTGGGFGGKEDYPDMIAAHAALLARKARRPVKIVYDRHEDIVATTKRHPSRVRIRAGARRDGTLVALDIEVTLDGGAYVTLSPVVLSRGVLHAGGPYRCPNVRVRGSVLATNTPPNGAFRGFGAPQTQFAMERHMDALARAAGIDPLAVRERNAYRAGDATPTGQVLASSVSALECLREAEARTGFRARWAAREAARAAGDADDGRPLPGLGLSLFWHGSGFTGNGERRMRSPVRVRLRAGGAIEVLVAATEFGQGTETVLAQIVADAAGIPLSKVSLAVPDTSEVPDSGPTVASRTVMIVGEALARAASKLVAEVAAFAEASREAGSDVGRPPGPPRASVASEFDEGRPPGPPRASVASVVHGRVRSPAGRDLGAFDEWADALLAIRGALEVEERHEPSPDASFDEATYQGTAYPAYAWGCDVVEVAVDPDTLAVRAARATFVCDVGRAIHPVLCRGQIEGGSLQALGWGTLEDLRERDGHWLHDRLATYIIPTAKDAPDMETVLLENPAPAGPMGAKGVGELPMDGGAPAILAAIENATGIVAREAPATPERLFEARERGEVVRGGKRPAPGARA